MFAVTSLDFYSHYTLVHLLPAAVPFLPFHQWSAAVSWLLLQVNIPKHVLHREEPVRAQVVLGSRTQPTLLELLAEAMHTILGCLLADVLCPICPVMAQHMDKCHPEYSIEKFTAINYCASTRYYWS